MAMIDLLFKYVNIIYKVSYLRGFEYVDYDSIWGRILLHILHFSDLWVFWLDL